MDNSAAPITFIPDVRADASLAPGGLGHSTVLNAPGVRVVVLTFAAGHVLKEHRAPKTLLMQALDGCLRVTAGGKVTDLVPGALLRLDESLQHEVEALEESRLMLTLIG
ncbi:quercetin dioxygenase-like cupin family protein [Cryobacterium sp. MP_M5]|uniref:cupin domain-containing protein n=1 Tax=unclassified Cryobacterium TaxID=2649013 RepID=UPI0018CB6871|nr:MULTISPECIES: cupin domain-containing protein [unclassified Cryobacterium]MBG6058952.1 quercetin dioxygenase-like cupin family protein [Cryobacterium sp. MP_M3]MEC5177039.1 quercetin dioxygenase-like cupin family protein [Cryobacterium sp. MP_M5]